jgi:hypothetical protein
MFEDGKHSFKRDSEIEPEEAGSGTDDLGNRFLVFQCRNSLQLRKEVGIHGRKASARGFLDKGCTSGGTSAEHQDGHSENCFSMQVID